MKAWWSINLTEVDPQVYPHRPIGLNPEGQNLGFKQESTLNKLKEEFQHSAYKNIKITDLRVFIERKLEQMIQQNATRIDFAQRLQEIIDKYNAGGSSTENYYDDLMNFAKELQEEDERHVREGPDRG